MITSRQRIAFVIFDPCDAFAIVRRYEFGVMATNGDRDTAVRPVGRLRFFLTQLMASEDGTQQTVRLQPALEMLTTVTPGGYHPYFGFVRERFAEQSVHNRPVLAHTFLTPGVYKVHVESDFFQAADVTVTFTAATIARDMEQQQDIAAITRKVDLWPHITYRFPERTTRLSGTLIDADGRTPIVDARVSSIDTPYESKTDKHGRWMLIFPSAYTGRTADVDFVRSNGSTDIPQETYIVKRWQESSEKK